MYRQQRRFPTRLNAEVFPDEVLSDWDWDDDLHKIPVHMKEKIPPVNLRTKLRDHPAFFQRIPDSQLKIPQV